MAFTIMLVSCGREDTASDDEIRTIGQAVEQTTRISDLVCHIGDHRYVVLLVGTNLQGTRIAADRIELALDGAAPGPISFGLAAYTPNVKESSELLDAAERALLKAEEAGGGVEFG